MNRAAIAAVIPLTNVAMTGVPVLGQTCENNLKQLAELVHLYCQLINFAAIFLGSFFLG